MAEKKEKILNNDRHWYAVHTYSGYEDAVARYLKQRVESMMASDKIFNVVVPKDVKVKIRGGKRYKTEEKVYPGYVLVDMVMDHDSWSVVRNTPRVTGFVGADSTEPTPLSDAEVKALLEKMGGEGDEARVAVDIRAGETVRISDGPFKDQTGKVAEIDEAHGKAKVLVPIFGRDTLLELDLLQIKKI